MTGFLFALPLALTAGPAFASPEASAVVLIEGRRVAERAALLRGRRTTRAPAPRGAGLDALGRRYGASRASEAVVRRWVEASGARVVASGRHGRTLVLRGPSDRMRSLEAAALAGAAPLQVRAFVGPASKRHIRPLVVPDVIVGDGIRALGARDFAVVYDTAALRDGGGNGTGASIAVVGRSNLADADLTAFEARFGDAALRAISRIFTRPGDDPGIVRGADHLEMVLDATWASAVAPGAEVSAVIASPGDDIPEAVRAVVEANEADLVSISFGVCEPEAGEGLVALFHDLYAQAVLQGQTVVVSSGDAGSLDCTPSGQEPAVNALASSPYALAVGGTALDPLFDEAGRAQGHGGEEVWNDQNGASGGGVSAVFGLPPHQAALGFAGRALPDLAIAASPTTPGYAIVRDGVSERVGGTSAGAPSVAGMLALAIEAGGGRLGLVTPALAGPTAGSAFRDVVVGTNGFEAEPGYDLATGWGSPVGASLVDLLAGEPAPPCEPRWRCTVRSRGRRGCQAGWWLPWRALTRDSDDHPRRTQRCTDGDPGCDRDGSVNGVCDLEVGLCLNVADPTACTARAVRRTRLLRPRRRGPDAEARLRLEGALATLPELPTARVEACSVTTTIAVPLRSSGRPGRRLLRGRVRSASRTLRPTVRLVCDPAS